MKSDQIPSVTEEEDMMRYIMERSAYHYDPDRQDYRFDTVQGLGQFSGDWSDEVETLINTSSPCTLANRGKGWTGNFPKIMRNPEAQDYVRRWYEDNTVLNYDKTQLTNKSNIIGPKIEKMISMFKLDSPWMFGVHVQKTGQMFPYHLDYFPKNSHFHEVKDVIRVMIMLTDWTPGQFMGYGNHTYQNWKAGDFHLFNHEHTPHFTANASYVPRVNLILTGIRTKETIEFFDYAKSVKTIPI
jgi:hypothetical protein